jgi:CDP-glycerol glycerophosphotransferase (TagB/SpsB family)
VTGSRQSGRSGLRRSASIVRNLFRWRPSTDSIECDIREIEQLGIFDREGYLALYPDVAQTGLDPVRHYVTLGVREGRNPCPLFDTAYYFASNPDVAKAGLNPLLHYFQFGWKEGRNPSIDFDGGWYWAHHVDAAEEGVNPLLHYLTMGRAKGLETRPVMDLASEALRESGIFDVAYYLENYPDVAESGVDPIRHYLKYGAREGRNPCAFFDTKYYARNNRDIVAQRINPLLHFCRTGWKQLRNPHPEFDVWWYWSTHLDPAKDDINPLAHYLAEGRELGLETAPPRDSSQRAGSGFRLPEGTTPRRVCLFAGYDLEGRIDDYVVDYLRELSRYADIHYLADCDMQPGELDRIAEFTVTATAQRHGEYDFGSYSRLARQVGWDVIEQYDELILANDSCYLLRDLEPVFAKMRAKSCDWWGMQATKGMAATRRNPNNRFLQPIPLPTVRLSMLDGFEKDYVYDFHVGTYFAAYRQPVIRDPQFRRLLESVVAQENKRNVILKYEIGLTRLLIARGFAFDTFIDSLYPFHPLYTNWYFRLLDEGFPFFKRYLLSENHYRVPRLSSWADKIRRKLPQADTDTIQRNLERVVDPVRLHENLHVGDPRVAGDALPGEQLLTHDEFLHGDQASPKYAHWWAFPVCAFTRAFTGNERAVFEEVKNDPSIKKIVLTRGIEIELDGVDVEVAPLMSARGQYLLMRSGNIFIKHSPTRNLVYPLATELHNLINLWHGVPFKRIGYASLDMHDKQQSIAREHAMCRAVISSSQVDRMAMTAAFFPLTYNDVWPTGLPRNDFILRQFELLPADFRDEERRLRALVGDRKLVLFMPTFRNAQEDAYYQFSKDELAWLGDWLRQHNAVFGVREHMADTARTYTRMFADVGSIDLSDPHFPNVEVLYRCSSALMTDYSSCFVDYMLTGKPAVSFAYDYERYTVVERGSFYDLELVFPGPVCKTFSELKEALQELFKTTNPTAEALLEWKRRLFFDHVDDRSSGRLVARVKELVDFDDMGGTAFRTGT